MFARTVRIQLQPNTTAEFSLLLEKEVLPILRKQQGFRDEITFAPADGEKEAVAISLWDRKEDAETYSRGTYPQVLKTLAKVVEGTPHVLTSEVSSSTCHKIAAR